MIVALTEADFVELPTKHPDGVLVRESALEALVLAVPTSVGFVFGDYRICQGKHAALDATRRLMDWKNGVALALAIFEDRVVGVTRSNLEWVEEAHRGNGLGPQLVAEMFIAQGGVEWTAAQWCYYLSLAKLTPAGIESRRRAFHVLVDRGIIENAEA